MILKKIFSEIEINLYVKDQQKSSVFYAEVFGLSPSLNVPGMTEFPLSENSKLDLMFEKEIVNIICTTLSQPTTDKSVLFKIQRS